MKITILYNLKNTDLKIGRAKDGTLFLNNGEEVSPEQLELFTELGRLESISPEIIELDITSHKKIGEEYASNVLYSNRILWIAPVILFLILSLMALFFIPKDNTPKYASTPEAGLSAIQTLIKTQENVEYLDYYIDYTKLDEDIQEQLSNTSGLQQSKIDWEYLNKIDTSSNIRNQIRDSVQKPDKNQGYFITQQFYNLTDIKDFASSQVSTNQNIYLITYTTPDTKAPVILEFTRDAENRWFLSGMDFSQALLADIEKYPAIGKDLTGYVYTEYQEL